MTHLASHATVEDRAMARRRLFLLPIRAAVLSVLGVASTTGLLAHTAQAQAARRSDDEDEGNAPLLLAAPARDTPELLAHSSHSSHRSHVSGSGGGGGGVAPSPVPVPQAVAAPRATSVGAGTAPATTTPPPQATSTATPVSTAAPTQTVPTPAPKPSPKGCGTDGCAVSSTADTDLPALLGAAAIASALMVRRRRRKR